MCDRMVSISLLGAPSDSLFLKTTGEIKRAVSEYNHSTRVWLGVKFIRLLRADFQKNANLNFRYSQRDIVALLGIDRSTVFRIMKEHGDTLLVEIPPLYKYLSPVEFQPKGKSKYFRRIATNYSDLVESGFFGVESTKKVKSAKKMGSAKKMSK